MRELDRLVALLEDAQTVVAMRSEDELRKLFATSRTDISRAFQGGVDGLLAQWDNQPNRIDMIRDYLLWDYIAYNAKEMYESYDLVREVLGEELEKLNNGGTTRYST